MKFVYFGYDFMIESVQRLIVEGHELLGVFSFPCDNIFNFNTECQALAGRLNIPFMQSPATPDTLENFIKQRCDLYLAAGYPHKIPALQDEHAKAVNIHPTYLPHGRGMMPIPQIIKENISKAAGFTAHKMTQDFDAGDILLQHKIDLSDKDCVESYSAKIAVHAPDKISDLVTNLEQYWTTATPQNETEASWYAMPQDKDRLLDWSKPVAYIDKTARAFGYFGSLAQFDGQIWVVVDYDFWEEQHNFEPGSVIATLSRQVVIAAKDGFVALKNFEKIQENINLN